MRKAMKAAYRAVMKMRRRANGYSLGAPYYFGWALREAFTMGVDWHANQVSARRRKLRRKGVR